MGWSCSKKAGDVIDVWTEACVKQTGSQNIFKMGDNRSSKGEIHTYFWETSALTEHSDGAITGSIWRFVDDNKCRRNGTFRIEGNGIISRAPKFLKNLCTISRATK
jgi:hypothetical protein